MNVDAGAANVRHSQANFGEYVNIQVGLHKARPFVAKGTDRLGRN